MLKKNRSSESSEGDSRGMKASKVQSALPIVKQVPSYSAEQLNVIFVVNVILKMGIPIFMADDKGFREWLAMSNPRFQLKHRTSISSLLKQISAVSLNKLKEEIKVAMTDGSKLALAVDAWTGRNHTKYLGVIGYWIIKWQLKDGTAKNKWQKTESPILSQGLSWQVGARTAASIVSPPRAHGSSGLVLRPRQN